LDAPSEVAELTEYECDGGQDLKLHGGVLAFWQLPNIYIGFLYASSVPP
jgi:hypothetical protein